MSFCDFVFRCCATIAAIGFSAGHALSQDDIVFLPDVECGRGGDQTLKLDLARPAGNVEGIHRPCVVVIHGGAWRGGNKEQHRDFAMLLARRGYVSASLQYRLCPDHVFPAQIEDVKCAVRYLRAHASEYGIDPDRFGAIGFSAGAHLSMMLGVMGDNDGFEGDGGWGDQSSQVQAVVSFFGPTELWADDIPDGSKPLVRDFIGGTPDEKPDAVRNASPVSWVTSDDAPMLLFQGTADVLVPATQAWTMGKALADAGVKGRVEILLGENHGWGEPDRSRTLELSWQFFDRHLDHTPPKMPAPGEDETVSLFDGKTLQGWEGDESMFRIEDGAIVGGMLDEPIPHNYFLTHESEFDDFELTLEFMLKGEGVNAGIQIRSRRIPDHHEMIGYQADLGQNYWGALYDESRRRKVLATPAPETIAKALKPDEWNHYRIRCEGRRIQLWINDVQTVDYTEEDESIEQTGLIGLQIHSGKPSEAWYRNLRIRKLQAADR